MASRFILFVTSVLLSAPCLAKDAKKGPPLFDSKDVLELEITSNFPDVNKAFADQAILHPGTLSYSEGGKKVTLDIELSARGGGRSRWCGFAPMRLFLPEKQEGPDGKKTDPTDGTLFEHSKDKLRLVTHCDPNDFRNNTLSNDNLLITEYMFYQMIEASGLPHLKTRLAHAKYFKSNGELFTSGYLIILENAQDMAQRYGFHVAEENPAPLSAAGRAAFAISLRLTANEADHYYENGARNTFTVGKRIANEDAQHPVFDNETLTLVPYDFVLSPLEFPFVNERMNANSTSNVGWFAEFASTNLAIKEDVVKVARQIVGNADGILQAMASVPFPNRRDLKERTRMAIWVDEVLTDAKAFVDGQQQKAGGPR